MTRVGQGGGSEGIGSEGGGGEGGGGEGGGGEGGGGEGGGGEGGGGEDGGGESGDAEGFFMASIIACFCKRRRLAPAGWSAAWKSYISRPTPKSHTSIVAISSVPPTRPWREGTLKLRCAGRMLGSQGTPRSACTPTPSSLT